MNLRFLRKLDRWIGPLLLLVLVPMVRLVTALTPAVTDAPLGSDTGRCVFLKLKGGGSLIMVMPTLLAMRRAAPNASFILVCTEGTKIYAELIGIFDRYLVIDDSSPLSLIQSAIRTLRKSFRADLCVDLEPHGIMVAAFAALTLSIRRIGFVKPSDPCRAHAYTDAISFNPYGPIYSFYDQVARVLNLVPASQADCRDRLLQHIQKIPKASGDTLVIGVAPFASELARERMMPSNVWAQLLSTAFQNKKIRLLVFGAATNKTACADFIQEVQRIVPGIETENLCDQQSLAEAAATVLNCDEFWAIDSGLLHIARLLTSRCRSFWGPTSPHILLRPMEGLKETVSYHAFACSPCVHIAPTSPCKGNNLCMKTMAEPNPDRAPVWLAGSR